MLNAHTADIVYLSTVEPYHMIRKRGYVARTVVVDLNIWKVLEHFQYLGKARGCNLELHMMDHILMIQDSLWILSRILGNRAAVELAALYVSVFYFSFPSCFHSSCCLEPSGFRK